MGRGAAWRVVLFTTGILAVGAPVPIPAQVVAPSMRLAPATGLFLIATPALTDPNFAETVVLICDHSADGTLGLIVNRPTPVRLAEVLPTLPILKGTSYLVYWGGPVEPGGVLMLFRTTTPPANTKQVLRDVHVGGNLATVERLITQPQPRETFHAYAGYAGWAPGQLDFEMTLGSWTLVEASAEAIFEKDPELLWHELLQSQQRPKTIGFDRP
jgi:putative transcriptional regulator